MECEGLACEASVYFELFRQEAKMLMTMLGIGHQLNPISAMDGYYFIIWLINIILQLQYGQ